MRRMSLNSTMHEAGESAGGWGGGVLAAHTDHSPEVMLMQLQGNILSNSSGRDECGLNGKNEEKNKNENKQKKKPIVCVGVICG